jgi:uncharacterized protein YkwD
MKNIITILLLILTITSYGQTQLDKEIFKVVNEYRISNGLNAWVWNQELFKVSEKHNYYQTQIKNISHDESIDIKGHVEVRRLGDRVSEGVSGNWESVGENLADRYSSWFCSCICTDGKCPLIMNWCVLRDTV